MLGVSKAVLVLDMPESCDVCPFSIMYETPDGLVECENPLSKEYGFDVSDYEGARPKDCPLRELPEKKKTKNTRTTTAFATFAGWNACIDEITGGAE